MVSENLMTVRYWFSALGGPWSSLVGSYDLYMRGLPYIIKLALLKCDASSRTSKGSAIKDDRSFQANLYLHKLDNSPMRLVPLSTSVN